MNWSEPQKHHANLAKVMKCTACGSVFIWGYYRPATACPECPSRARCKTLQNIESTTWFTREDAMRLANWARNTGRTDLPAIVEATSSVTDPKGR